VVSSIRFRGLLPSGESETFDLQSRVVGYNGGVGLRICGPSQTAIIDALTYCITHVFHLSNTI
jgi:hypothetical protein